MRKILNGLLVGLGFLFLGIGAVGVVLPILPTTPFLLLAALFFAKGSKRFHKWFLSTTLYKKHIDQIVRKKAMTCRSKATVLITISAIFLFGFLLSPIWHVKVIVIIVWMFHFYYFLFKIRTIKCED